MRKFVAVLLLTLAAITMLSAEDSEEVDIFQLYGAHYLNRNRAYEGNTGFADFSDSINSWGVGGTIFAGFGTFGVYSQTALYVPTGHTYDPESSMGEQELEGFRLGVDNLSGLGINIKITPAMGILLGGGFHWDLTFMYKDIYYDKEGSEPSLIFDLGLGGAGDFYIMVNEQMSIYFGGIVAWDFLVLQGNSYLNQNWDKADHWIYGFNAGVGFSL